MTACVWEILFSQQQIFKVKILAIVKNDSAVGARMTPSDLSRRTNNN